jgi:cytochrome c oxidase cbb3-type subunit 3
MTASRVATRSLLAVALGALTTISLAAQAGPADRQVVDEAAAARGRSLYALHCINCHGGSAKGGPNGPDLIRSAVVLRDRLGNGIAPALRQSPAAHQAQLTDAEVRDLSHFLHQRVEATARNRTATAPINVLTGDAAAGRAYFNGAGKCSTCHSPAGDLAGIGRRIPDPVNLQQRFLFPSLTPGRGRQVEVTVTSATGPEVSGTLVRIDSFSVSLRDPSGEFRSFRRVPGMNVEVHDPLAVHHALLDQYTDADMHNEDELDPWPRCQGAARTESRERAAA